MKKQLWALLAAAVIVSSWSKETVSASPQLQTLPLERDIWITGTIQRGSGKFALGDYTTIRLDRPSTSPCNDQIVTDLLLGEGESAEPALLLPYLNQLVAVRGRVNCPETGVQFAPQPDVVFPIY